MFLRHLRHLALPILGDVKYGSAKHNRLLRETVALDRMALHAVELAFDHPITGVRVVVIAPVPADLRDPMAALGATEALWDRVEAATDPGGDQVRALYPRPTPAPDGRDGRDGTVHGAGRGDAEPAEGTAGRRPLAEAGPDHTGAGDGLAARAHDPNDDHDDDLYEEAELDADAELDDDGELDADGELDEDGRDDEDGRL